jgi:uncharacterized beta barrel domain-containing protein DUF5777
LDQEWCAKQLVKFKSTKMKFSKNINRLFKAGIFLAGILPATVVIAQDEKTDSAKTETTTEVTEQPAPRKAKPVKIFESVWIGDNQTVMVPSIKTFEMDIQHRFGTIEKGYQDFWGLFAPSNIRLGFSYSPVKRLNVGIGITKSNLLWDGSVKYAIIEQTKGKSPVSVTYFGDMSFDTRKDPDGSLFKYPEDRYMYFHQLIVGRKVNKKLAVQVAGSISHQNSVYGYYYPVDSTGKKAIGQEMKHDHFAVHVAAQYKLTTVTSLIMNYDQPVTEHTVNNPNPNLLFGVQFNTSNHSFQIFMGNFQYLSPQRNNLYNHNNYEDGEWLIGFNITRLWNY